MALTKITKDMSSTPTITDDGTDIEISGNFTQDVGTGNITNAIKSTTNGYAVDTFYYDNVGAIASKFQWSESTHGWQWTPDSGGADVVALQIDNDSEITMGAALTVTDGIYLGGTDAANLLDDYEEGTWTPTIFAQSGSFGSITYDAIRYGNYTKTGRKVFCEFRMRTDAITMNTASGRLEMSLPFTVNASYYGSGSIGFTNEWLGEAPTNIVSNVGQAFLYYYYLNAIGGDHTVIDVTDVDTGVNDNDIIGTASFTV